MREITSRRRLLAVEHRRHRAVARVEVEQGCDHRVCQVEGDRVPALAVSPGSTSAEVVADHRRDLVVGASQLRPRWRTAPARRAAPCRRSQPARAPGRGLILQVALVQLQVALLHRRSQDHVAADPDQRRLRPCLQRRTSISRSCWAIARRPPPAVAQLVGREARGSSVSIGTSPGEHPHLALLAGAVPAAGGVDRDPFSWHVEHGVPAGTRTSPPSGRNVSRTRPVPASTVSALTPATAVSGHVVAAACRARCAAIQRAPHSSRRAGSRRRARLHALAGTGVHDRAGEAVLLATARKVAPSSATGQAERGVEARRSCSLRGRHGSAHRLQNSVTASGRRRPHRQRSITTSRRDAVSLRPRRSCARSRAGAGLHQISSSLRGRSRPRRGGRWAGSAPTLVLAGDQLTRPCPRTPRAPSSASMIEESCTAQSVSPAPWHAVRISSISSASGSPR